MDYIHLLEAFSPASPKEEQNKAAILGFVKSRPLALTRADPIAHICCSAFVVNPARTKTLMVHHNIMNKWSWTGGHADGEANLALVALREAREETGLEAVELLTPQIAGLDILTVEAHEKNGAYVNAHLHLSVAFLAQASEAQPLRSCAGENTSVRWVPFTGITPQAFGLADAGLYARLIARVMALPPPKGR